MVLSSSKSFLLDSLVDTGYKCRCCRYLLRLRRLSMSCSEVASILCLVLYGIQQN